MISAEQCRAARALLDWDQKALAEQAQIGLSSVRAFERDKERKANPSTILSLRVAFEKAGIEFIEENGNLGLILRKKT